MEKVTLNNGVEMPVLGLGTYKSTDPVECSVSVKAALECGYRMIDTAQLYGNEDVVGKAIKESGISRDEIFLTTKIWCDTFSAARKSGIDLEALYKEGVLRAIGVSNFNTDRLIDLINYNEIRPAVNQIETNLQAQRLKEHEWMTRLNVQHEGYMPFGQGRANEMFEDPKILEIAAKYGKTPRQVALRYQIQCGVIVIPKSVNPERVRANADVFDFAHSDQDMAALRSMDMEKPLTGDPETPERTMKITGFKL